MAAHVKQNNEKIELVVAELNVRSIDRTRKDIVTWRQAHIAAESVYNPNRSRLYDLYSDILLDGHLSGIIAKRMDAVLNKPLYFEQDGVRIPQMEQLINSSIFRDILTTIMETQLWGISGIEFIPGPLLAMQQVPRKHIKPNLGLITFEQTGDDGIPYAPLENIWILGADDDLGLLLKCAPYALYKRGGLADWSEYVEIFGQPVRVMKYDAYDEQTKIELKRILDESGSSLSMMIPRQAEFEMKDGKQANGDGRLHLQFVKALNDEMSIIVLGNTETSTSNEYSGYAQARIHMEEQHEITRSDLAYVTNMLNDPKFIQILGSYGYPVAGGRFAFVKNLDLQYLKDRVAIDTEVAKMVPISEHYWYSTYGIPAAK